LDTLTTDTLTAPCVLTGELPTVVRIKLPRQANHQTQGCNHQEIHQHQYNAQGKQHSINSPGKPEGFITGQGLAASCWTRRQTMDARAGGSPGRYGTVRPAPEV